MRFPLYLTVTIAGAENIDPCWFAGMRFARTVSSCKAGICEGVLQKADSKAVVANNLNVAGTVPLSCAAAGQHMEEFLREYVDISEAMMDVNVMEHEMSTIVAPAAREMLFNQHFEINESVRETM